MVCVDRYIQVSHKILVKVIQPYCAVTCKYILYEAMTRLDSAFLSSGNLGNIPYHAVSPCVGPYHVVCWRVLRTLQKPGWYFPTTHASVV